MSDVARHEGVGEAAVTYPTRCGHYAIIQPGTAWPTEPMRLYCALHRDHDGEHQYPSNAWGEAIPDRPDAEIARLEAALAERDAELRRVLPVLLELEWLDDDVGRFCRLCGNPPEVGHTAGCEMRQALAALAAAPGGQEGGG